MKPCPTLSTALLFLLLFTTTSHSQVCSVKASPTTKLANDYTLYSTSGNMYIDQATIAELGYLANCFLVVPNFYFYDDNDGKNSKASAEITNSMRPDGTIIFGKRLFNSQFLTAYGSTAIPIIIAHEFAHIADFKYGALNHVSGKKRELFADYLAGIYMSLRIRRYGYVDISATRQTFEELGDTDFGDVDHHGTPDERVDALMSGYNTAESYFSRGVPYLLTLKQCITEAKNYLSTIEDDEDPDAKDPS